ncbi:ABC transporter ATP-binding protein [Lederbergia wuyishanensis]|uniref:ABC-2 type transport system ATP-binding protein n=1 Tax=Lederbergia wuyishanensis TaxID=1347903 RepID=A0ABU0D7H7_9BACI|nr:ABC transporter ATP-binding protein [Lederbergia wuyishanensis]MCJ8009027.1 ABC transporter ATP-binding protein [Lederbergia wuyishanensis]MDQ0344359.1 ABC-2 type transport system ATP-binding protein [Lederbergia wuyishanensis]
MENIIELKNVSKKIKDFQLKNISFEFKKGYIMGLIGPNGAGKSTLIRCLMDLVRVDDGEVNIFGMTHMENTIEIKQRIGFVYDESHFYDDLSLEKNKKIIAPFYRNWDDSTFYSYIKKFNLPLKKKIKTLSKGMKMKFAIAMALSHNPDLIILDEPTAGLDPVFRREMLDILQDIIQDENKSVFFSTHITTDLDQVADYITFINNGEIVFSKEKDIIFEEYFLLKGPDSLAVDVPKVNLIGGRKTGVGFEALVDGIDNIEQQLLNQLHIETPSLETIMYYTIRGNSL